MANYQQWSESYFVNDVNTDKIAANLTPEQHAINNKWFTSMLSRLTDDGILYVPVLGKQFNKQGEEVTGGKC